jgi:hypothetical protein
MRQKDGIVCLVNPCIRRYCKIAGSSDYHLSVSVYGHRIHSVYFPPSFPINDFARTFCLFGSNGTVIGDINTRFGSSFQDSISGPRERMNVIQDWLDRWHLQHLNPKVGATRVDHVFTSVAGSFVVLPAPVATDHPIILAKLKVGLVQPKSRPTSNSPATRRFRIKRLEHTHTANMFRNRFEQIASSIPKKIVKFDHDLPRMTTIARCREVEKLDHLIMTTIQRTAEEILGVYVPKVIKNRPDSLKKELETANSNNIAIQAFKRIQRVTVSPLSSSRPALSVEQDVSRHIQEVYASPLLEYIETEGRAQHAIMFPPKQKLSIATISKFGTGNGTMTGVFNVDAVK